MKRSLHLVAAGWLLLAAPQFAHAQPVVDPVPVIAMAEEITGQMAQRQVDGTITALARAMQSQSVAESLRGPLEGLIGLGSSQYVDRVYVRDFGRTTRDVIYKIRYDHNTLYVRYLFSVEQGAWRLMHFYFQTETGLPFPKEWIHIYPG
jgi:predicted transcriptional regulator